MEDPDGMIPDPEAPLPSRDAMTTPPPVPEPPHAPPIRPVVPVDPIKKIPLDENGNLAQASGCRRCDSALIGLRLSGSCPKCALPIARSVLGDEFRYCDPTWVRVLGQGLKLILIGTFTTIGLGLLLFAAMMVYVIATTVRSGGQPGGQPDLSMIVAGSMVVSLPMLLAIFGIWRLTTPDPGQVKPERPINARTLARWCVMAALVSTPIALITSMQSTTTNQQTTATNTDVTMQIPALSPAMQTLQWFGFALGGVSMVGYVAFLVMLRRLADRVPSASLVGQAKIVIWGYGISQTIAYIMGIFVNLLTPAFTAAMSARPPQSPPVAYWVAAGGAVPASCVTIVFGIWAIVLIFMVFFAIRKEAAKAEANWGSG